MTTCSSILAWKIPWTEEPVGLLGLQRTGRSWSHLAHTHMVCLHQVHSTSYKPEMYQQSLNNITVTPFSYHKCSQDVTWKTEGFYSNTSRNTETQLSSWIPDEIAHHSCGSLGEFPRPCMSVRQQGNLTGLSFLLCKMTGLGQMASAVTDSVISRVLDKP